MSDAEYTVNFVKRFFDSETLVFLKKIKPTYWNTLKTEAIDFTSEFLWFDDFLFDSEKADLIKNNALDRWIEIDLSRNLNQLKDIVDKFPR